MKLPEFLASMRCPVCREALAYQAVAQPGVAGDYGVLSCGCYRYPLIDGVPIVTQQPVSVLEHATGSVEHAGPAPAELSQLVLEGRGREALLRLIAFPALPKRLYWELVRPRRWPLRRLQARTRALAEASVARPTYRRVALAVRRASLRRRLASAYEDWSVEDWLDLFYLRSPLTREFHPYFLHRFGQPRMLAALSLLRLLPKQDAPVLDVACGFGHLTHSLTAGEPRHEAVGLDRLFFQAWTARHWVAPEALFVCADAEAPLPFADGSFSGLLCSDAFSYLRNKRETVREFRRCTADGTILLTRVGNRAAEPLEDLGEELSPEEYAALFDRGAAWFSGEKELQDLYLRRQAPDLSTEGPPAAQHGEKWLSIVLSRDPQVRRAHEDFQEWPHAAGRLALNPIYDVSRQADGALSLRFRFPSEWYAFQNQRMLGYHAPEATVSPQVQACLQRGERSAEIEDLIRRFVVIGLPERYLRGSVGSAG